MSLPSVIGLGAAIDYVTEVGIGRVEGYNLSLRGRLYTGLRSVPRLRVVSAPPGPLASPLLTYRLPTDIESAAFHQRMYDRHKIRLKVVPKEWLNSHRVSTHLFNTEAEVDALVAALGVELA